jgi:hypothetical protein
MPNTPPLYPNDKLALYVHGKPDEHGQAAPTSI